MNVVINIDEKIYNDIKYKGRFVLANIDDILNSITNGQALTDYCDDCIFRELELEYETEDD